MDSPLQHGLGRRPRHRLRARLHPRRRAANPRRFPRRRPLPPARQRNRRGNAGRRRRPRRIALRALVLLLRRPCRRGRFPRRDGRLCIHRRRHRHRPHCPGLRRGRLPTRSGRGLARGLPPRRRLLLHRRDPGLCGHFREGHRYAHHPPLARLGSAILRRLHRALVPILLALRLAPDLPHDLHLVRKNRRRGKGEDARRQSADLVDSRAHPRWPLRQGH